MSVVGSVSFAIDGDWLTDFLRQRFLYEGIGFEWVVETVGELLKSNGLTEQRIEQIAQDIILGRSYFKGNTRDGSFVYCDCSDEPLKSDFFRKYTKLQNDLKKEEQARKDAVEAWQELALVITGELKRDDCGCQCNIDFLRPTPAQEFIDRMIGTEEEVAPYGFFSPDGEFHPVEWADHERFACDYIRAHDDWENVLKNDMHTGTDYLVLVKGWLLLHNPRQGVPFLTSGDRPMTKAQREALFDYYTKYGMKKEASALYQEVEV